MNPGRLENLNTSQDDNCGGGTSLRAILAETHFKATAWPATGAVAYGADDISVGQAMSGAAATATRTVALPLNSAVVVAVDVGSHSGAGADCTLQLATSPLGSPTPLTWHSQPLGAAGTKVLSYPTMVPGNSLRRVQIACTGNRKAQVDWLQIQDADELFPPPGDLTVTWKDTRHPGGGLTTSIVADDGWGAPTWAQMWRASRGTETTGGRWRTAAGRTA